MRAATASTSVLGSTSFVRCIWNLTRAICGVFRARKRCQRGGRNRRARSSTSRGWRESIRSRRCPASRYPPASRRTVRVRERALIRRCGANHLASRASRWAATTSRLLVVVDDLREPLQAKRDVAARGRADGREIEAPRFMLPSAIGSMMTNVDPCPAPALGRDRAAVRFHQMPRNRRPRPSPPWRRVFEPSACRNGSNIDAIKCVGMLAGVGHGQLDGIMRAAIGS